MPSRMKMRAGEKSGKPARLGRASATSIRVVPHHQVVRDHVIPRVLRGYLLHEESNTFGLALAHQVAAPI
jgi:hypothetical protein